MNGPVAPVWLLPKGRREVAECKPLELALWPQKAPRRRPRPPNGRPRPLWPLPDGRPRPRPAFALRALHAAPP